MVLIVIRRCVRADREDEFLKAYDRQKPGGEGFISETLTKLSNAPELPEPMRSFALDEPGCITYVNIAKWESAEAFRKYFDPQTSHDPELEVSDRLRAVLEIVTEHAGG
jgi:hypothetical protein